MRRPFRRLGMAVTVLVVALLLNFTWVQVVRSSALRADPNNTRSQLDEATRARGQITAAGGVVLARSQPSNDSSKYQRIYPGGAAYLPITGYYSSLYGATGIEKSENSLLSGNDDALIGGQLSDLITGRDPRGGNVELTVVPAVQQAAYQALSSAGFAGAVVAIKPSTGEILALASTPTYDPTPLASHFTQVQRNESDIINNSAPSVRLNRATGAVYPPGSTFKLVLGGAALQRGYTPTSKLTGLAKISLPGGGTLSNFQGESCAGNGGADVTMTQALALSCNTAFARLGIALGAEPIRAQAAALGVNPDGFSVGIDVVGSRLGTLADPQALAQSSIGQRDVAFTPMQNAIVAATIANHGVRMAPYLVARTTAPDLSVISTNKPQVAEAAAMPTAVADDLRTMMVQSEKDTFGSGSIADLVIASKTGTAEHGTDPKQTPPHCWYVAFAPADNPQVAVAVLVENGGNGDLGATGGKVAGPIGRQVIAAALSGGR